MLRYITNASARRNDHKCEEKGAKRGSEEERGRRNKTTGRYVRDIVCGSHERNEIRMISCRITVHRDWRNISIFDLLYHMNLFFFVLIC